MIEDKINLYNNTYVKGEVRSKKYNKQLKQKEAVKNRHLIADELFNEVPFMLNDYEKSHVHFLIDQNKNFKKLHAKASNETIILAFIFYTKINQNTHIRIQKYKISKKYNLTHNTFEIILCKLVLKGLKETNIYPTVAKGVDHNILYKGELK